MTDILLQIGATKLALAMVLAGAVWAVQQRVKRPATVHALWLMVLVVMLVPAVVPLRVLPEEQASVEAVAQADVTLRSEVAMQSELAAPSTAVSPPAALVEDAAQSEPGPAAAVAHAGESGDATAPGAWLTGNRKSLVALLWLLGSAGFLGWTVARTVRFQRMLTKAARPAPQLQRLAADIGDTLRLPLVPRVYTTGARVRPLVWWAGGRVRVLIPAVFVAELDETELRAVLAHELAHVRRRDYLVRVVELLACSAYWWNPVVWWAKRRMRSAEESCCDVLAVAASKLTRDRYAKSLLRVVEIMSAVPVPRAPALASAADSCRDSRRLEQRLRTVMATSSVSATAGRLRVAGTAALACGLSLGLVYCTPGERQAFAQPQVPTAAMVKDSAGIRIIENASPPDGSRLNWRVGPEPTLQIGQVAGEGPNLLRDAIDATRLSDGRIVVAENSTQTLRVFDAQGAFLAVWGGAGAGPGEFTELRDVTRWPGDSIAAWTAPHRGISVFASDGSFGRSFNLENRGNPDWMYFKPVSVAGNGSVLAVTRAPDVDTVVVQLRDGEGSTTASFGTHPSTQGRRFVEGERRRWFPTIFGREPVYATWGDLVVIGSTDRYELKAFRADGTLDRIVRRGHVPRAPTRADVAAYIDRALPQLRPDMPRAAFENQRRWRRRYEAVPVAEHFPVFESIMTDAMDHLWVEEYEFRGEERPGKLWTVFDPAGHMLGFVETPELSGIYEIGEDYILTRVRDEQGVEYVKLWPLDRSGG